MPISDAREDLRERYRDKRTLEELRSAPRDDPDDARIQIMQLGSNVLAAVDRHVTAERDVSEGRRALAHAVWILKRSGDFTDRAAITMAESILGYEVKSR